MFKTIRVKGYKTKPRAPRRRIAKKPLVKLIKQVSNKVANSKLETKYVADTFNNITFNSAINSFPELYSCYPLLGAGTLTYQRVGIDVTPIRVKNTWVVSINNVARSENLYVDLYIMIDKLNRYYPQVAAPGGGQPQLLRSGSSFGTGAVQGYNGFNTDSFKMINKERYTLLKHFRFQLVANVGKANNDTTNGNAPNVPGQSAKTLTYVLDSPKILRYNPQVTTPDYPAGHAPFWCLGYSKVDGTPPDVVNQSITVSHITEMIYKDA